MKIGCWEVPKPTDPSLLWPAEWKAPAPLWLAESVNTVVIGVISVISVNYIVISVNCIVISVISIVISVIIVTSTMISMISFISIVIFVTSATSIMVYEQGSVIGLHEDCD